MCSAITDTSTLCIDVIQIWDTFLADSKRFDFVIYVCCSMILYVNIFVIMCGYYMKFFTVVLEENW